MTDSPRTIVLIAIYLIVLIGIAATGSIVPFERGKNSGQTYYELLREDAIRNLPHLQQGNQQ